MPELLQQIDSDYYRALRLVIARAELERLRQGRPAIVDAEESEPDSCEDVEGAG